MKNAISIIAGFALAINLSILSPATGQQRTVHAPDLTKFAAGKGWKVFNRKASASNEGNRKGVHFDEREGDGGAWLENFRFADGTIEFDAKGNDALQRSFLGIAFHGVDSTKFDAVYFRPFNFRAADPVRRSHAVQYVSHPQHPWSRLREEQPGKYEQPVAPAPDPNGWFHVRIVVDNGKVAVFVNGAKAPSLTVEQLSDRKEGLVGFWVGNNSGGDFANLRITPE